jgi:septum formation protein
MDRLGVEYEARAHNVDEDLFKTAGTSPAELAQVLAREKALSLAAECPGAWVLGSDQVAVLGDEILSKPGTAAKAEAQLTRLSGRSHELITAVALAAPTGEVEVWVERYRMRMRTLTSAEIARYVAADEPLDCCGSYRIESRGITLFDSLDGGDFTAIIGLPLIGVSRMLRRAGFALP